MSTELSTGNQLPTALPTGISTEEPVLNAQVLAEQMHATWAGMVSKDRSAPSPHPYVYAGGWRACDRRLVYEMLCPDQAQPFSPDTLANFRRGNDRERELLIDLARVGRANPTPFEVIGQQERFELKDRKGRVVVVGKTDARLKFGNGGGLNAPAETKAWNPNTVARISRFEDLFQNPWTRAGAYQLLCYLYGANEPIGFLILDRNGLPLILPVVLYDHLDAVEHFLTRAQAALDHREAGTLPDFHNDPSDCKRCPFFATACQPPIKYEGASVITDPEILQMLEIREQNKKAHKDFEWADSEIKKRLRGVLQGIAGAFMVSGKWGKNTTYDLPEAIKTQYKKVDEKGKFTLTITRVDGPVDLL